MALPKDTDGPPDDEAKSYTRLSVNISYEIATIIRDLTKRRKITATEGIRRAVVLWEILEDAKDANRQVHIIDPAEPGIVHVLTLI